jgi:hypothetical protein
MGAGKEVPVPVSSVSARHGIWGGTKLGGWGWRAQIQVQVQVLFASFAHLSSNSNLMLKWEGMKYFVLFLSLYVA